MLPSCSRGPAPPTPPAPRPPRWAPPPRPPLRAGPPVARSRATEVMSSDGPRCSRSTTTAGRPASARAATARARPDDPTRSRRYASPRPPRSTAASARGQRTGGRRARRPQQISYGRVGPVVAEQMGRHPVRHSKRSGQERSFRFLDQHQVGHHERSVGHQPGPGSGRPRRSARQLEPEADGGPTAGHVVVQVAVQAFEADVEVGSQGDEQEVHVEGVEAAGPGQSAQPQFGPAILYLVGLVLDRLEGGSVVPLDQTRCRPAGEQLLDVLVRDVQAAERILRGRVVPAPVGDQRPDPRLDDADPSQQVGRRRLHRPG